MTIEIRAIVADELRAWRHCILETFGVDASLDRAGVERLEATLALERCFAAFDRGRIVGTAAGFDFTLAVPGGSVPMSGLTVVTVRPTHRRRGILTALMAEHFAAARRHGDVLSGLWASEATIYGRFGYGVAAESDALTFTAGPVALAGHALDDVELAEDDDAAARVPAVYEEVMRARPGCYSRSPAWWRYRRFMERPEQRSGASPRRHALILRGGRCVGYVAQRQRMAWNDGRIQGTFEIDEAMALDAQAERTLWNYVAHIDLFPSVTWWNAPVDCALGSMLVDRRRVVRKRADTLWLRPDALGPLLEARRYDADGALVLAVDRDGGRESVRLEVHEGRARVTPTDAEPDVVLGQAALGAIYLGGVRPSALAYAGHLRGSASALAQADRIFVWPVAPWCPEVF